MKIIALSGLQGAGKDTAGAYLVEKYGYQKVSFSAALKDVVARLFHVDREMLEGVTPEARASREEVDPWWSKELGREVSSRDLLIEIGTDVMREHFDQRIWMLSIKRQLELMPAESKLVFTDARFFNEMNLVKSMGGKSFGIYRKLPRWLDDAYSYVNDYATRYYSKGFMELELLPHMHAKDVQHAVRVFLQSKNLKVSQSEWEHLFYNAYTGNIDNTGSIASLHAQLDKIA
jgi:hypothetical protein